MADMTNTSSALLTATFPWFRFQTMIERDPVIPLWGSGRSRLACGLRGSALGLGILPLKAATSRLLSAPV